MWKKNLPRQWRGKSLEEADKFDWKMGCGARLKSGNFACKSGGADGENFEQDRSLSQLKPLTSDFREKTMPHFKLPGVMKYNIFTKPDEVMSSDEEAELVAGDLMEEILRMSVKRVMNKRKRVKRRLNMRFFKSWAMNSFCEPPTSIFRVGLRTKQGHDCEVRKCGEGRPSKAETKRIRWSSSITISVYSRDSQEEKSDLLFGKNSRDGEEENEGGGLGLGDEEALDRHEDQGEEEGNRRSSQGGQRDKADSPQSEDKSRDCGSEEAEEAGRGQQDHVRGGDQPGVHGAARDPRSVGESCSQSSRKCGRNKKDAEEGCEASQGDCEACWRALSFRNNETEKRRIHESVLKNMLRIGNLSNQNFVADSFKVSLGKRVESREMSSGEAPGNGEASEAEIQGERGGQVPKLSQETLETIVDNIEHTTVSQLVPEEKQEALFRGDEVSVSLEVRVHPSMAQELSETESVIESENETKAEKAMIIAPESEKKKLKRTVDGTTVIVPKEYARKRVTMTSMKGRKIGQAIANAKTSALTLGKGKYQCEIKKCGFICRYKKDFLEHAKTAHDGKKLVGTEISQEKRKTKICFRQELGSVVPTHVIEKNEGVKQWDTVRGSLVRVDTASKVKEMAAKKKVKGKEDDVIKAKLVERHPDLQRPHVIPLVADTVYTDNTESEDESSLISAANLNQVMVNGKVVSGRIKKTARKTKATGEKEKSSDVWKLPNGANSIEELRRFNSGLVTPPKLKPRTLATPKTPSTVKRKVVSRYQEECEDSILAERDIHKRDKADTSDGLSDLSSGSVSLLANVDTPGSSTLKANDLENKLPVTLNFSGYGEGDEEKKEEESQPSTVTINSQNSQKSQISQESQELVTQIPPGVEVMTQGTQNSGTHTTFEEDYKTIENANLKRKVEELEKDIEILESSNVVLKVEVMKLEDFKSSAREALKIRDEALAKVVSREEESDGVLRDLDVLLKDILSQNRVMNKEDVQTQTDINLQNLQTWEFTAKDEANRIKEVENLEIKKNRAEQMQEKLWNNVIKMRIECEHHDKVAKEVQKARVAAETLTGNQQRYIDLLAGNVRSLEQIGRDKDNKIKSLMAQIPCKERACDNPKACGKSHSLRDPKKKICDHFKMGKCSRGQRCKFSHEKTSNPLDEELRSKMEEEGLDFDAVTQMEDEVTAEEIVIEDGNTAHADAMGQVENTNNEVEVVENVERVEVEGVKEKKDTEKGEKSKEEVVAKSNGAIPKKPMKQTRSNKAPKVDKAKEDDVRMTARSEGRTKGKEDQRSKSSNGQSRNRAEEEKMKGMKRPGSRSGRSQADIREFYIPRDKSNTSNVSRSRSRGPSPSPGRTSSRSSSTVSFASARSSSSNANRRRRSVSRSGEDKENRRVNFGSAVGPSVLRSYPRNGSLNNPEKVGRWYLKQAREEQKMKEALRADEVMRMSNEVLKRLMRDEESNGITCIESYRQLIREEERRKVLFERSRNRDEGILRDSRQAGNVSSLRDAPLSGFRDRGQGMEGFQGMEGEQLLSERAEGRGREVRSRQDHLDRLRTLAAGNSTTISESVFRARNKDSTAKKKN